MGVGGGGVGTGSRGVGSRDGVTEGVGNGRLSGPFRGDGEFGTLSSNGGMTPRDDVSERYCDVSREWDSELEEIDVDGRWR